MDVFFFAFPPFLFPFLGGKVLFGLLWPLSFRARQGFNFMAPGSVAPLTYCADMIKWFADSGFMTSAGSSGIAMELGTDLARLLPVDGACEAASNLSKTSAHAFNGEELFKFRFDSISFDLSHTPRKFGPPRALKINLHPPSPSQSTGTID